MWMVDEKFPKVSLFIFVCYVLSYNPGSCCDGALIEEYVSLRYELYAWNLKVDSEGVLGKAIEDDMGDRR